MAREKSELKSGISIAARIFLKLVEAVEDEGGDDNDVRLIETDEELRRDLAERIVARVRSAKKFALKHLKLIAEHIPVSTSAFARDSFFRNGPVKLWFGDIFKNLILSAIPETVPGFAGNLTQTKLTSSMYDREILAELGNPEPSTVQEFAAIAKSLIEKQPNGEEGTLLTNGCASIFYVKLPARNASHSEAGGEDERVIAVRVYWRSLYRTWHLDTSGLDDDRWRGRRHVFSRS